MDIRAARAKSTYTRAKTYNKENILILNTKNLIKDDNLPNVEESPHLLAIPKIHTNEKLFRRKSTMNTTKFSIKVGSSKPFIITNELLKEINCLAGKILQSWNSYIEITHAKPIEISKSLASKYNENLKTGFNCFAFPKLSNIDYKNEIKILRLDAIKKFNPNVQVNMLYI